MNGNLIKKMLKTLENRKNYVHLAIRVKAQMGRVFLIRLFGSEKGKTWKYNCSTYQCLVLAFVLMSFP